MMLVPIMSFLFSFLLGRLIIPMFTHLLEDSGSVKSNFRGEIIPVGMGLIFVPVILLNSIAVVVFVRPSHLLSIAAFLAGTFGMCFAGMLDDLLGNRNVTGLKGHIRSFFQGKLTTGGFKALFGGFLAFFISILFSEGLLNILINSLMIALFTNFNNLLDLRPGRSIKGFLLCLIPLFWIPVSVELRTSLFGLLGVVLAYTPYDLKAKAMLGDAGSNVLGISLGILFINGPFLFRLIALALLILIHGITEKYSLTKIIENNKFLNYVDQIGR
ncbi:glycosyl transferase [Geosporobacter ferrireducens]|uniref:glycosyl transferase n=1 Tax=Geosporobacter ferrireducens TaxID=1424294 RepID=UPI002355C505|nr:glycosyl transferase [Geosporobacter ferrireducens]